MIANCPACGTHYKHDRPPVPTRARCVRCDTAFDLSALRPYRIDPVAAPRPEDVARAARHLPIGLDDPALATTIARNVRQDRADRARVTPHADAAPVEVPESVPPPSEPWDTGDPLPPIPEMHATDELIPTFEVAPAVPAPAREMPRERPAARDEAAAAPAADGGRGMTFVLWLVAGAIVGTGASWAFGGTTLVGMGAGVMAGGLMGWGWLRWTSPK